MAFLNIGQKLAPLSAGVRSGGGTKRGGARVEPGAFVTLIAELRGVRLVCEQVVRGEHMICSDRTVRSDHIVCAASTHEKHEHYPGHEIKALLGKRVHRSFS